MYQLSTAKKLARKMRASTAPPTRGSTHFSERSSTSSLQSDHSTRSTATAGGGGAGSRSLGPRREFHMERHVEEVQKWMDAVSNDMWETRLESIKGGDLFWPEPSHQRYKPQNRRVGSAPLEATGRTALFTGETPPTLGGAERSSRVDMVTLDLITVKEHALKFLKPSQFQNTSELEALGSFIQTVRSSKVLDEFVLSVILYFRYFLKIHHMENPVRPVGYKDPSRKFIARDPLKGVNKVIDIWPEKLYQFGALSEEQQRKKAEYTERLEEALQLAGTSYTRLAVLLVDHRSKDGSREKAMFRLIDVYMFLCLKQLYDHTYHEIVKKQYARLTKTDWFSSFSHMSLDEITTAEKKPINVDTSAPLQDIQEEDAMESSGGGFNESSNGDPSVTGVKKPIKRRTGKLGGALEHDQLLPKNIRESITYRALSRMRKQQEESSELIKKHRPSTAPANVCRRALMAERPSPAQSGTHDLKKVSPEYDPSRLLTWSASAAGNQQRRPSTAQPTLGESSSANTSSLKPQQELAVSFSRRASTATVTTTNISRQNDLSASRRLNSVESMQPECRSILHPPTASATSTQMPPAFGSSRPRPSTASSTLYNPTIASLSHMNGVIPKKRRRVFTTLLRAKVSQSGRLGVNTVNVEQELADLSKSLRITSIAHQEHKSQHVCLDAQSPFVAAVLKPKLPLPMPTAQVHVLHEKPKAGAPTIGRRGSIYQPLHSPEVYVLSKTWSRYETEVKDQMEDVDLVDKVQMRWNIPRMATAKK